MKEGWEGGRKEEEGRTSRQLPVGSGVRIITRFNIKDKIIFRCLVSFLSSNWLRDASETDIRDIPFQRGHNS